MANQDNKSFVDSIVNAQKQAVDAVVENTRKFANGNNLVNDTVQKGSEWYKNWLDNQTNIYTQATEKTANMTGDVKDRVSQMNEFYQNWFKAQTNWAKQIWEMNAGYFQNATANNNNAANANPLNMWSNMMNNWNTWMTGVNNTNTWMNMMQQWNSMFNLDAWKKTSESWTGIFNQYNEILNNNLAKFQENIQNGTAQDAYRSMLNANEGFTRFYEMWMPMWKSIQDKTFNNEIYQQWVNPAMYKDLMDKYFGFIPEGSRQYVQQFTNMMQEGYKQAGAMGMQNYHQMRSFFPGMNTNGLFEGLLNNYNTAYNMMNDAVAPFTKMMTPNQHTHTLIEWQDIANRMAVYNIKNAELQYMMYTQGTQVMDKLAENVIGKIQSGEEINSIMALYQEWMNISDKTFVSLFESDEYSKLMAEVSAMQMKLRKDIETQLEKLMVGIPVATRSEMDELYKTIYDLKKQVRQLEKMMELDGEEGTAVNTDASAEESKGNPRRSTAAKKA